MSATETVLDALAVPEQYRQQRRYGPQNTPKYSQELGEKIAWCLAEGMSLRQACEHVGGIDKRSVHSWVLDPEHPFGERYQQARLIAYHGMADDILEIVDDGRNDWMQIEDAENPGWRFNGENVQRSKLRADKRQWMLSKMLPKIYGDKITVDHQGEVNHRVTVRKAKAMDVLEYEDLAQLEAILSKAEALQIEGKVVDQEPDAES